MTLEAFTGDAAPSIWRRGAWGSGWASVAGPGIGKGRRDHSPTRPPGALGKAGTGRSPTPQHYNEQPTK